MNNKILRAMLLSLGLLLIACAVLLMGGSPVIDSVVCSSPVYTSQSVDANGLESIADTDVPLAAPAPVRQLDVIEQPVLEQPIQEQPTQEQPAQQEPAQQEPAQEQPAQQEPAQEQPAQEQPAQEQPAQEQPAQEQPAQEEPAQEQPAQEEPQQEEPVVVTSAAIRLLDRANTLLAQYNACTTMAEKRALLGASNNSLGNDAIRTKLLADLGGSWEQLESEVVQATEYQQGKTLYVQVYMSGVSSNYVPVVYTTQNSDRSGNQWATNLVYDADDALWMEYTQKHAYNSSRVGFYMTTLYNNEDGWEELEAVMEESPVWQPVEVTVAP